MRLIDRPEVLLIISRIELKIILQKIQLLSAIVTQLLKRPGQPVLVKIAVGELTQVTAEEIRGEWLALVNNSPLEKAALTIRLVRAEQQCMACFHKYHPLDREISCPQCGSAGAKIIAGEEFHLESTQEENE